MERCQERNVAIRLTNSTRTSAGEKKTPIRRVLELNLPICRAVLVLLKLGQGWQVCICLFLVSSLYLFSLSHLSVSSLLSELSRSLQMCPRIQRYPGQRITPAQSESGQHSHTLKQTLFLYLPPLALWNQAISPHYFNSQTSLSIQNNFQINLTLISFLSFQVRSQGGSVFPVSQYEGWGALLFFHQNILCPQRVCQI